MTDLLHQLHLIADTCDKHGITGLRSRKRAARKIVAATLEIERLRKDAERYRWLRASQGRPTRPASVVTWLDEPWEPEDGDTLDEFIDAAMNDA